jgi:flagellar hook-associated protein 1 FlgK
MANPGTFYGLDIGTSALLATQVAQDVTGNNIANASTAGYTVETATFNATDPWAQPDAADQVTTGQLGSGVVVNISRSRDQFLDAQVRNSYTEQGTQNSLSNWLDQVQSSFNEPSTSGINASLSTFFNSFQTLENNPEDEGVRTTVIGNAQALTNQFNTVQSSLDITGKSLATSINSDVSTINSDATQIAQLNGQIRAASTQGVQPNALLDQRDLLLDNLSKTVNISTHTNSDGTINVSIGSANLVQGTTSSSVTVAALQSGGGVTGGDLAGSFQAQTSLAGYQTQLDTLASTLASSVNAVQENGSGLDGSTGVAFFTGTDARTLSVNQTLVNNPDEIAAAAKVVPPATTPPPGDASNAVLLAGVANTSANATTQQFVNQRDSVSGVSTDQELTQMIQYQNAYQAAAKFITAQSTMLSTLIQMVQ